MFFKTRSTASILSSFLNTVKELETHAVLSETQAADRHAVADAARKEAEAHEAEAKAATNAAAKIKNLFA